MINNTQLINEIICNKTIYPFCPLGNDFYKADIEIAFMPNKYYFDYMVLDERISKLSGQSLTIEDLAKSVFDIVKVCKPVGLKVIVKALSDKHFPVTVIKGMEHE